MIPRRHFDAEHELFRTNFRRFLAEEVTPHQREWEAAGMVPKALWRRAGELGFLATFVDEQYGGAGCRDFRYEQIVSEELGFANEWGLALSLHSSLVAPYLDEFGSEDQKRRYLPGVVSGECVLAVAMTEPNAGSDLAGIQTRAEDCGDFWALSGTKTFISNGVNSDLVIVAARTHPTEKRGLSLFLVEKGWAGFEVGRKLEKIGQHSQDTAELFFRDVKVPKQNLLGEPHAGFKMLMRMLVPERLTCAVGAVAAANAAYAMTLAYVKERKAFGQQLFDFQNTRFELAAIKAEIDVGQVYVDRLVVEHNAGTLDAVDAAEAKLWTSELLGRAADRCLQLFGGYGFMAEYPIGRLWASARVARIYAGSSEIMKEIIAKAM
ncbi:acyl-CoA dehydrogenase family protein [Chitinimonas sp. BJB300]|uniref:acyl-CoA dehydrogenase family protein n=1 Tax=Chitinimonas sp. BJB300 TaxID=1559339 RepID=UPI0026C8A78F|nr:acyl-CoA dehydrogenase family protein [Chitinimonas sp. BJB300]